MPKTNDPTYVFVSLLEGFEQKPKRTFKEAFADMYNWVENQLDNGGMSYQVLETAIWIKTPSGTPLMFYDARDLAISEGIMKSGGGLIA